MPTTGDTWINLATGQILDFATLQPELIDGLIDGLAELRADVYGQDTTLGSALATFTYAASTLDLDATRSGSTPDGYRITADHTDAAWQAIPFLDTPAVIYHIGARRQVRPSSVTGNTADGGYYYDQVIEDVGELGAPSVITNRGAGAGLFVDVNPGSSLLGSDWTVADTRPVVVYLVSPVTASADAIYEGVIAWDAGAGKYRITVPHYFGQDSAAPSTTAAAYRVLVRGPTITTTPLGSDPSYWYLGACTSGVYATTGQNLVPTWGSWLSMFNVEHDNASGMHKAINADSFTFNATAGRTGTYQVEAVELQATGPTWRQNGGGVQSVAYIATGGTAPAHVKTATAVSGTWAEFYQPVRFPPDQDVILNDLSAVIWLATAAPSEYVKIDLVERQIEAAAWNTIASWTLGKPAGATWGIVTPTAGPAFPFTIPAPASTRTVRLWRVEIGEPNTGNTRLAGFYGTANAAKVSPIPH